jgi:hypothetical protein
MSYVGTVGRGGLSRLVGADSQASGYAGVATGSTQADSAGH